MYLERKMFIKHQAKKNPPNSQTGQREEMGAAKQKEGLKQTERKVRSGLVHKKERR